MARVVNAMGDISGMILDNFNKVRLNIRSGSTPEAVDWEKVLPFRVGRQQFYDITDIRNLRGNDFFNGRRVRIRKKGQNIPKKHYEGHYDMLVDIYDIGEDMLVYEAVPIDSTLCFQQVKKSSKKKKKSRKRSKKSKKSKKQKKRSKKRTKKRSKK